MIIFHFEKRLLDELVHMIQDLYDENREFENFDDIIQNYSHCALAYKHLDAWIQNYKNK